MYIRLGDSRMRMIRRRQTCISFAPKHASIALTKRLSGTLRESIGGSSIGYLNFSWFRRSHLTVSPVSLCQRVKLSSFCTSTLSSCRNLVESVRRLHHIQIREHTDPGGRRPRACAWPARPQPLSVWPARPPNAFECPCHWPFQRSKYAVRHWR